VEGILVLHIAIFMLAVLWDLALGEPKRWHPVAGMGRLIYFLERRAPREGKALPLLYGLGMAILVPGVFALATYFLLQSLQPVSEAAYIVIGGYILKSSFAVRELERAALRVHCALEAERLDQARESLKSLVSRDTTRLSPELVTAAAVESVAENTTDSFVAPWLAFALLGLPGAVAYRAINTLDSMVGYHARYEYLGKAAARLDDLVNLIPARLAAGLIVLAAGLQGLRAGQAWRVMWREHGKTESPNAGWTMGAMAGALGVELQKVGHYRLGTSLRSLEAGDIKEAVKMMRRVAGLAMAVTLGILVLRYGNFLA
jgi:adenosylcobinamide-phosphate synthase